MRAKRARIFYDAVRHKISLQKQLLNDIFPNQTDIHDFIQTTGRYAMTEVFQDISYIDIDDNEPVVNNLSEIIIIQRTGPSS